MRPFDPQLHFIYECESANFFLEKYIYIIFFSISSFLGQTLRKGGEGVSDRQMDRETDSLSRGRC